MKKENEKKCKWRFRINQTSFVRLLITCLILSAIPLTGFAQSVKITGSIKDYTGEPLSGVNIIEKGTTNGVISDLNGKYTIEVSSQESILDFSYIGFVSEQIAVSTGTVIDVVLIEDITSLQEIVVVGYGVQKKSDVTGAMISVSEEDLNIRPVSNAFEALQGMAAGVDVTSNERPGEIGKITIRGMRSMIQDDNNNYTGNDPLYVVDGVVLFSTSSIETINPRDIESIDILKDASATAIYGSRGANGVILITTKRGEEGALSLNYSGSVTTENIVDRAPMMSASDYITWRRWAYYNANDPDNPTEYKYPRGDQPDYEADKIMFKMNADPTAWSNIEKGWEGGSWDGSKVTNTDWTDFVSQTAVTQEHTLSASGGTEKIQAFASFGYLDQDGTQIGQEYSRYTTKISVDIQAKDWFKMGGSINAAWSDQDYGMNTLGAGSTSGPNSIYEAAKRVYNYALPYDENGEVVLRPGGDDNVYTVIDEWNKSTQQRQMFRALASLYATLDIGKIISPLEGLRYRINFGPDYRNWREGVYMDAESVNRLGGTSYARLKNQRDFSWTLDNIITYDKSLGRSTFGVTLLQSASTWNQERSEMSGQNIVKPSYLWNAFGTLDPADPNTKAKMSSGITEKQLTSYMGRLNYSFLDRYLVTVSGRWDGASQLSQGHKGAFFPSAALGWRISQENFMQNVTFVDQLKLRFGFGTTGNSTVNPYDVLGKIQSFYVPFGDNNELAYSINEPNYTKDLIPMANKELGWEITKQFNLGFDFSFLNGRVGGVVDLYKSYTTDLLMKMIIPTVTGYNSTLFNVGETKNKGVDITINTINILRNDFQWSTAINAAWQKDEIVELAYGKNDMVDNAWFIGESIAVIYGIDGDGLWSEAEAAEMDQFNANGHEFEAGMAKPVDQNGDYKIDDEDRVIIGNTTPRWTLGFNNSFSYKGFELDVLIYGRLGFLDDTKGEGQLGRYNQREISYWTPNNTDADYQKPIYSESGGDAYSSTLGYYSGSFLKLRTVSLGYTLPSSITDKLKIENLKLYIQGKNLGMLYSAIDFKDMDTGSSLYNRGFVVGINVGF